MTFSEIITTIENNTNTSGSSASSYPLASKVIDINNALNNFFIIANTAAGNWKPVDDTNQTDYPVILGDITTDQQDYTFNTDENGNQILDIYKVRVKDTDGNWRTLTQINQFDLDDSYLNNDHSGIPERYYITANGIFLVERPNFTQEDSLEVYISRTGSYFTASDTTKKAGIPWVFHEYLALKPSYQYALRKGLSQATSYRIALYGQDGRSGMEKDIRKYYSERNKDFQERISAKPINSI